MIIAVENVKENDKYITKIFKSSNSELDDILKNAEVGEGTIKENMEDLCDIFEYEILRCLTQKKVSAD